MNEKDLSLLRRAYAVLQDVTPFSYDCGKICSARCCGGGSADGMWLLPGEEQLLPEDFTILTAEDGQKVAVCGGLCQREHRPFSCRIFPLFPVIREDEAGRTRIRAEFDPRAVRICPIAAGQFRTQRAFRLAVIRATRLLLRSETYRAWFAQSGAFLSYLRELQSRLDEE